MKKSRIYLALLVMGTAFWGISFPLVKDGLQIIHPYSFLLYRFSLAAIVLSILFFSHLKRINLQTIKYGMLVGIPLFLAILLQTVGLQYTSSANASFISGMDVLLIPVLKLFIFKKSVKPKTWIACSVALVGLYIIAMSSEHGGFNHGDLYVLAGAFAFGCYVLLVGKYVAKAETILIVIIQIYTCAIAYGILVISTLGTGELLLPTNSSVWKAILFTGVLATAYMYGIQNISQRFIEEEKIALTYLCEPVFAVIAAYFLINESITLHTVIGGLCILIAMFISEFNFRKKFHLRRVH